MSCIKSIFWNAQEGRLRAGWRLLIQLTLFFLTLVGLVVAKKSLGPGSGSAAVVSGLYLLLGLGAVWLLARFIDHRPFAAYGFHFDLGWWSDFGFGLFLGAILITGIFITEQLAGWVVVSIPHVTESGLTPGPAVLLSLYFYLIVAFNEEFAFRGYQMRNLAEGLAGRLVGPHGAILCAWAISSVSFGLGHVTNDNATWLSAFNTVGGGLLLSLPYLLTGELAIPIGLHTSWNLFQGTIFGFAVSGSVPTRRILVPVQHGPAIWTGGDFGPEGGLLATVAILAGCGLIALWIRARRGRLTLHAALADYEPEPRTAQGTVGQSRDTLAMPIQRT